MNFEKAFKKFLIEEPFYGLFCLSLDKKLSDEIETAAVCRNNVGLRLIVNPTFWNSLSDTEQIAVLKHEMLHICFNHLFMIEEYPNAELRNVAMDLEVNSYIENLPSTALLPEQFNLEVKQGTRYYYNKLQNNNNSNNEGSGEGSEQSPNKILDSHNTWDKDFKNISKDLKQLVQNQINSQLKSTAEQVIKNRGTIPGEISKKITELLKPKPRLFDWKAQFRRMLGFIYDILLKKTYKKESIRFEGSAGLRHKKKVSIMIGIDTSESVSNKELEEFFSEIYHIWKAGAKITIVECDSKINRIYDYNGKWDGTVSGRGGTEFYPVIDEYLKNRKDYSTLIYLTDGECTIPDNCPNNMIWIISSNGRQDYEYPGKVLLIPKNNE